MDRSLDVLATARMHSLFPQSELTPQLDRCRERGCPFPAVAGRLCRIRLLRLSETRSSTPSTMTTVGGIDHRVHVA
jgi:hypothetical protein